MRANEVEQAFAELPTAASPEAQPQFDIAELTASSPICLSPPLTDQGVAAAGEGTRTKAYCGNPKAM